MNRTNNPVASVKSLAGEFTYGYDAKSPALLTKMTGPAHSVETIYEPHRNLVTGVVNKAKSSTGILPVAQAGTPDPNPADPSLLDPDKTIVSSYTYGNDILGRRETISQGGEAFAMLKLGANTVDVAYNDRSEVIAATTRRGDTLVARQAYAYDGIGNRTTARSAGEPSEVGGGQSAKTHYETNALNQYSSIRVDSSQFVVQNSSHDLDGNLIEDARNTYAWNADNNLIRVDAKDGKLRLDYTYDYQSRRTVRTETNYPGKDNETRRTIYYLYDDWNLVADLSADTGRGAGVTGKEANSVRYYAWGRDLSGSLQGAGGVGGLLAISKVNPNPNADKPGGAQLETSNLKLETLFPTYDANGNIGQLIDGAGSVVAAYTYDPFGNVTEMAGQEAAENPWRFSTKPVEAGTGWLYYGYRYYVPWLGRWPNRDPIGEQGGGNVYGFVGNNGVNGLDYLGLITEWISFQRKAVVYDSSAQMGLRWAAVGYTNGNYGAAFTDKPGQESKRIITRIQEWLNEMTNDKIEYEKSGNCCVAKLKSSAQTLKFSIWSEVNVISIGAIWKGGLATSGFVAEAIQHERGHENIVERLIAEVFNPAANFVNTYSSEPFDSKEAAANAMAEDYRTLVNELASIDLSIRHKIGGIHPTTGLGPNQRNPDGSGTPILALIPGSVGWERGILGSIRQAGSNLEFKKKEGTCGN